MTNHKHDSNRAKRKARGNPLGALAGSLARLAFLAAGGWLAYSRFQIDHQRPLPKAIPAEQITLAFGPTGSLSAYYDRQGSGRPLLLLHSINAAASAYEMRPLFQHYRSRHPIVALDLPGYGFSSRPNYDYTPEVFIKAILGALHELGGGPADVVALSLSCEFAAEVALRRPDLVHSLALISPTGLSRRADGQSDRRSTRETVIHEILTAPLWARPLFDLVTTRWSIEYYLQKSFVGPVPPEMVEYAYSTAHQPGAEHAALAFLSGRLFHPDIASEVYANLTTPTLVIHDRDAFVNFDLLPEVLGQNPAWRAVRIAPTLGLPHFERLAETSAALDRFWQDLS